MQTIPYSWEKKIRRIVKDPVKLTALIYLKEALRKEQYELCPEIIATAKEFGAGDDEIRRLIEDPRRSPG